LSIQAGRARAEAPTAVGDTLAAAEQRPDTVWHERAGAAATGKCTALFVAEDGERWLGEQGKGQFVKRKPHAQVL